MTAVTPQLFICYTRRDASRVGLLYQALSRAGCSPWMDTRDILVGENWRVALLRAIQSSHFFLVALSSRSVDRRGEMQRELQEALDLWRSFLPSDIFILPVRIEDCKVPAQLCTFRTVDLFEKGGFTKLMAGIHEGLRRRNLFMTLRLRHKPYRKYSKAAVQAMLARRGFFEKRWNVLGRGPIHLFAESTLDGVAAVIDHGTNLIWQIEGSDDFGGGFLHPEDAKTRVDYLNTSRDGKWRLPTLEEAASLLTPYSRDGLFVPEVLAAPPYWIWTCDTAGSSRPWSVSFGQGECRDYVYGNAGPGVRAVQSFITATSAYG